MASKSSNKLRKRVEAESDSTPASSLKRAKDGSAFAKCEECHKDVPVALISFHSCSLDAKIKMNLETTDIEKPEAKKTEKKARKVSGPKPKRTLVKKGGKKRPPTAFFVFMNDFRKTFKEENPGCKSVSIVAKEGGVTWKAMSDEERKVYIEKAAELKAEYEKEVAEEKEKAERDVEELEDDVTEDEKEVAIDEENVEVKEEETEKAEKDVEDAETEGEKEVKEETEDAMDEEKVEVKEEEDE